MSSHLDPNLTYLRIPILNPSLRRATTNIRLPNEMVITLNTGDVTAPGRAKVNIYTNPGWIKDNIERLVTQSSMYTPTQMRTRDSSAISTNIASVDAVKSVVTTAASVTGSGSAATTDAATPSEKSAAERTVAGGGWLAAAAVFSALLVV